jgi:hypothetical protein
MHISHITLAISGSRLTLAEKLLLGSFAQISSHKSISICLCYSAMPGHTKLEAKKHQIYVTTVDKWMDKGLEMYWNLHQDPTSPNRIHGLAYVCSQMEDMCWKEDKVVIKLSKQTLNCCLQRIPSQTVSNAQKNWLTNTESNALIEYSVQLGNNGWPFSWVRLHEHAIEICQHQESGELLECLKCLKLPYMP